MKANNIIYILLLCIAITSCERSMTSKVNSMMSQHINMNINNLEQLKYYENEKRFDSLESKNCKYDLVVYYDSMECVTCITSKMHDWNKLIQHVDSTYDSVRFLFVFSPKDKDRENLSGALKYQRFAYPVYLDVNHQFAQNNSFIPDESMYHTFLVERETNKIVLVGDPRRSERLMVMFYDILDKAEKV